MRWQILMISFLSIAILSAGFYASWFQLWDDQNWFARAGGTVVFLAGSWLAVSVSSLRSEIDKLSNEIRQQMEARLRDSAAVTKDIELPIELSDVLGESGVDRLKTMAQAEIEQSISSLQKEHEYYHKGQLGALRFIELFWLGIGTLVWAWGDMIQHLSR